MRWTQTFTRRPSISSTAATRPLPVSAVTWMEVLVGAESDEEEGEGVFRLSKIAGNVIYAVIVLLLVMEGFKLMKFDGIARLIEAT